MECFAFNSPSSGVGGETWGNSSSTHPSAVTGSILVSSLMGKSWDTRMRVEGDGRHSFHQSSTFPRSRSQEGERTGLGQLGKSLLPECCLEGDLLFGLVVSLCAPAPPGFLITRTVLLRPISLKTHPSV